MILETEHDAETFRGRQTPLERLDDPRVCVVVGVALERRLDAAVGHEVVEVLRGAPGAGVDPHHRNAEVGGDLDLRDRAIDVELSLLGVGGHEALMRRESHDRKSESLGASLVRHHPRPTDEFVLPDLIEQELDAVEAELVREVDAAIHVAQLVVAETPQRVRRECDRVGGAGTGRTRCRGTVIGGGDATAQQTGGETGGQSRGQERSSVLHGRLQTGSSAGFRTRNETTGARSGHRSSSIVRWYPISPARSRAPRSSAARGRGASCRPSGAVR